MDPDVLAPVAAARLPCPRAGHHERGRGDGPRRQALEDAHVGGVAGAEVVGVDDDQLGVGRVAEPLRQVWLSHLLSLLRTRRRPGPGPPARSLLGMPPCFTVSSGSPTERMRTASRPALRAPLTAMVATGTPLGICTMDSRLSRPSRCARATGTPMTGRVVTEASIPGRWAAPPAPAISTRRPAGRRLLAEGDHVVRGPVGRDHPYLVRHAEALEHLDGPLHHGQVRRAAHDDGHDGRRGRHRVTPGGRSMAPGTGVPRATAADQARDRATSASSPHTVTWPSLRPGLAPLP